MRGWLKGWFLTVVVIGLAPAPCLADGEGAAHQQFVFAYRLLQLGEDAQAAEAFDAYLKDFPKAAKRADGLYYRALLHRRSGDNKAAAKLLADAGAPMLVPGHALALLRGQVSVDLQDYETALASLEPMALEGLPAPIRASALYLKGLAYRGAGNAAAAAASLEAAAKVESKLRARALLEWARLLVSIDQVTKAIEVLDRCIAAGDRSVTPTAAMLAGDLHDKYQQYPAAVRYYQTILKSHQTSPQFPAAVLGVLWAHFSNEDYPSVLGAFEQYKQTLEGPDKVAAWYLAGSACYAAGEHAKAAKLLDEALPSAAGHELEAKLLFKLAASQFESGDFAAMTRTLSRLSSRKPNSPLLADAAFLLAAADAKSGETHRGIARLTGIITQGASHPYHAKALLQRALLHESVDRLAAAAGDYESYLAAARSQQQPAEEVTRATLRLVHLYQKQTLHEQAAVTAGELLKSDDLPAQAEQDAMHRRLISLIQLKQLPAALAAARALLARHPNCSYAPLARYYRGLLAIALKESGEQAVGDLMAAAESGALEPGLAVNAWRFAAIELREAGKEDEAAKSLLALQDRFGGDQLTPQEQLWLAGVHLRQGDGRAALAMLEPLLSGAAAVRAPAAIRAEGYLVQGRALRSLGELEPAAAALRQVIAMDVHLVSQARLELARVLDESGQTDAALDEYAALSSNRTSEIAARALYQMATIHRRLAQGRSFAGHEAAAREANRAAYGFLKRVVLLYSFDQLSPLPELARVQLAELASQLGEPTKAKAELEALVKRYPDSRFAAYAKARLALREGRRNDAAFLLKKLKQEAALQPPGAGQPNAGDPGGQPDWALPLQQQLQSRVDQALADLESRR